MNRRSLVMALVGGVLGIPAVAGAGGGIIECEPASAATNVVVIEGSCFTPGVVHVAPGATVTWRHRDDRVPHTVTGTDDRWGSYEKRVSKLGSGDEVSYAFDEPGTYMYTCLYHMGMNGVVVVGDGGAPDDAALQSTAPPGSGSSDVPVTMAFVAAGAFVGGGLGYMMRPNGSRRT